MNEYELDDVADTASSLGVMEEIKKQVNVLRSFREKMEQAEAQFKEAKEAYENFATNTLPDMFKLNGISAVSDDEGHIYAVETVTSCSINKNAADKNNVINWLRQQGADTLVKGQCVVPLSQKEALSAASITYEEETTVNTNSVKSFVLSALGQKESPATIAKEDLPKGLNFFQYDHVVVK